ncbi:Bacteriocin/lantibiotic efflux ABC transporter, permease/ATP-binding protein [Olavius algarvensis associated proteobacterium Delta 3]|nr:Bacteriocin/lantibiotic efflux ABC transporter, permease/ATP-binding protein [Olavius algarvensis associated proteobacterium Delta 3]
MSNTATLWRSKRVRTPTVLQMEAVECGAAALGMILGYHKKIIPLEELRVECGVSRDGSKASNVIKAARKYGMDAKGFRKEPEQLTTLPLPMILFWNFNHFVVLEGIKGKRVFIRDPASGPRAVSYEEFDQSFTGVVLTFVPGPTFQKGGEKRSVFASLRRRLRGSHAALAYAVLAGLFLVLPGLVIPTFQKIFVDSVLIGGMKNWLKPLLLAMVLTAVVRGILIWLQENCLLRTETKLALSNSSKFFQHVFRLPVEFFDQRFGGEIASRVLSNDKIAQLLSGELATTMLSLITIGFYAVLMVQYDVVLTLVGVSMALLNLLALRYTNRKRLDLSQRLQQEIGKFSGLAMSGLQMIETIKASGSESDFFAQWSGHQAKVMTAQQEMGLSSQLLSTIPSLLSAINTTAILALGGLRIIDGQLTMGMLLAFQSLMAAFLLPVTQMVNLGGTLQEAKADMNRLDDVLRHRLDKRFSNPKEAERPSPSGPAKLSGRLELKDITFGYSRLEEPLIQDFNLLLEPGARVALVGGSGSGKSTVAKLITGLYEIWSGEILFDDKPFDTIPRHIFTNSVAMVDQDIFLFEGTVRENLTMWDPTVPDRAIFEAAKDAEIYEDIAERPGGYLSPVAEGGSNFSGGQRQRLEIARAVVGNPRILILDEATSALDPTTESLIDSKLRRRGCTCLIIAHRLSTIRDCDEIIVLDRGAVVQRGTHNQLREVEGPYADLIKAH